MNRIDVTNIDKRKLLQAAYDLSKPVGMGLFHYEPDQLSDEEADGIIERTGDRGVVFHADYVLGRQVKLVVFKGPKNTSYINGKWFDHSDSQLQELLRRVQNAGQQAESYA